MADFVVPISYALDDKQHARNLRSYKYPQPSHAAHKILSDLLYAFLTTHIGCLSNVANGPFTHYATVPSTKNRSDHPLSGICRPLPWPSIQITPRPGAFNNGKARKIDFEGFAINEVGLVGSRVLLIDDTWTTGSRIQSISRELKQSGADVVIAVVLGRWINTSFEPGARLTEAIRSAERFDLSTCVVHRPIDPSKCDPFFEDFDPELPF
ncbi:hypothetical protein GCM10029992_09750 [Glycomyces albus]